LPAGYTIFGRTVRLEIKHTRLRHDTVMQEEAILVLRPIDSEPNIPQLL
jgi:hypothetical protein